MISLQEIETLTKGLEGVIRLNTQTFEKQMTSRKETGYYSYVDIPVKIDLESENIFSINENSYDVVVAVNDRFRNTSLSQISRRVFIFYVCRDKKIVYALRCCDLKEDVLDKLENEILEKVEVTLNKDLIINGEVEKIPHQRFKSIDLPQEPRFKKLRAGEGYVYKMEDLYVLRGSNPEVDDILRILDARLETSLVKIMELKLDGTHIDCLSEKYLKVEAPKLKQSIVKLCQNK